MRDIYYRMDYALKIIFNSKGTLYLKKDYNLKNTLNFERIENKGENGSKMHQA